jgi:outer membrane murein-binding lipoprotein Lpp
MSVRNWTLAVAAGALCMTVASGCVPKPKQNYTTDQVKTLESLEELMRVQAETADPQFNRIGQSSFTDADYASLAQAAGRLQATSETLRSRHSQNRPPTFTTYATRLNELSGELLAAAQAKEAAKISDTLTSIRDICRTCHKEHR